MYKVVGLVGCTPMMGGAWRKGTRSHHAAWQRAIGAEGGSSPGQQAVRSGGLLFGLSPLEGSAGCGVRLFPYPRQ
jgi:hypothetical protein